jgi:hypothetical protein
MGLDAALYVPDVTVAGAAAMGSEDGNQTPTSERAGISGALLDNPSTWILIVFLAWAVVLFGGVHLDVDLDVGD